MCENDDCEAPSGNIGLGLAYDLAYQHLCDAGTLEAGLNRPREPAARQEALAEWRSMRSRVRIENKKAWAKWEIECAQARAEGRPLPDPPKRPDESHHPDISSINPEAEAVYNDARCKVELRMREAFARGELKPTYQDREGRIRHCIDRRVWEKRRSLPGVGLLDQIHPASCPGPPDLDGCFVFLNEARFTAWLEKEPSANRARPVSQRDLEAAYLEHVRRIGAAGHSSLEDDHAAMRDRFPGHKISRRQIEDLRRRFAPKEWKHPGTRKR
jgi:hypothetical protein